MGCLRSLGCYDSTAETSEKCSKISRHVILALVMISTSAALSYAVFIVVQCNNDTDGKDCALGPSRYICTQNADALASICMSVFIILIFQIRRKYSWSIMALAIAIVIEVIYVIIVASTENAYSLTAR